MPRSLRVRQDCIPKVKLAVQRNGYPRQKDFAEDVGCSLATASNFLNGKPVDFLNFTEICNRLGLDWKDIAVFGSNGSTSTTVAENAPPETSLRPGWSRQTAARPGCQHRACRQRR